MEKEKVLNKWYAMIKNSWTYEKMTKEEQTTLYAIITSDIIKKCLKGTAKQRWNILQAIYLTYLLGLGCNSPTWREEEG